MGERRAGWDDERDGLICGALISGVGKRTDGLINSNRKGSKPPIWLSASAKPALVRPLARRRADGGSPASERRPHPGVPRREDETAIPQVQSRPL